MKVYRTIESFQKGKNAVATIGTFDGVHIGHKEILGRLRESAQELGGESVVISMHPHPRLVLFPDDNPLRLLQTVDEKIETMDEFGIDKLLLIPFTKEFSRVRSEDFIEQILVKTIGIKKIIIGYDHRFGKNRTGGLEDLRVGSEKHGFEVEEIPARQIDDANVSSTKIRNALMTGDVETANTYLDYPYRLSGEVIKGQQLGRTIGYPTANILPGDKWKLIPADGVYWVEVRWEGLKKYGMLNIGKKPTVGEFPRGIEVNIFDFDGDLYGKEIQVRFLKFIREDQKFDSLEALIDAIRGDEETCRKWMQRLP